MAAKLIYRLKGDFFKALAHPLRIRILEVLVDGERTVGELLAETGAESSHLSQQLGILRERGIVISRREGPNVRYCAKDPRIFLLLALAKDILTDSLRETESLLADLEHLGFGRAAAPPQGR